MNNSNPFHALVVAIPDSERFVSDKGDEVENAWEIVLNVGEDDGIESGNTFLIFALGPEVQDPVTHDSLGHFEIVRGRGKVTHLQQKMCTIRSSRMVTKQIPGSLFAGASGNNSTDLRRTSAPFKLVAVGDFARLIS